MDLLLMQPTILAFRCAVMAWREATRLVMMVIWLMEMVVPRFVWSNQPIFVKVLLVYATFVCRTALIVWITLLATLASP